MNLVENHNLARKAEKTYKPVLCLKNAEQGLVDGADAEWRKKSSFPGCEPGLGFHIRTFVILGGDIMGFENRYLALLHFSRLGKKGVGMH